MIFWNSEISLRTDNTRLPNSRNSCNFQILSLWNGRFFQDQPFAEPVFTPLMTLLTMLVSSTGMLTLVQFPTILATSRTRLLLGFLATCLLGLGCCVLLEGPVPAFVAILAVVATMPRVRKRRPSLLGFCLAGVYLAKRVTSYVQSGELQLYEVGTIEFQHTLQDYRQFVKFSGGERRLLRVGRPRGRTLLPDSHVTGASSNFREHEDDHRVEDQARVRARAAGTAAAERHTRLHRRRGNQGALTFEKIPNFWS